MMFPSHRINRGLCLVSALALLVAVLTSPIRPSRSLGAHSHPGCLRRNFGIPTHQSPLSSSKSTAVRVISPVKAIRQDEKQPRRAVCLVGQRLDLPCSPTSTPRPAVELIGSGPAYQPLRC